MAAETSTDQGSKPTMPTLDELGIQLSNVELKEAAGLQAQMETARAKLKEGQGKGGNFVPNISLELGTMFASLWLLCHPDPEGEQNLPGSDPLVLHLDTDDFGPDSEHDEVLDFAFQMTGSFRRLSGFHCYALVYNRLEDVFSKLKKAGLGSRQGAISKMKGAIAVSAGLLSITCFLAENPQIPSNNGKVYDGLVGPLSVLRATRKLFLNNVTYCVFRQDLVLIKFLMEVLSFTQLGMCEVDAFLKEQLGDKIAKILIVTPSAAEDTENSVEHSDVVDLAETESVEPHVPRSHAWNLAVKILTREESDRHRAAADHLDLHHSIYRVLVGRVSAAEVADAFDLLKKGSERENFPGGLGRTMIEGKGKEKKKFFRKHRPTTIEGWKQLSDRLAMLGLQIDDFKRGWKAKFLICEKNERAAAERNAAYTCETLGSEVQTNQTQSGQAAGPSGQHAQEEPASGRIGGSVEQNNVEAMDTDMVNDTDPYELPRDEEEAEEGQDGDAEALRQKQPVASGQPRSNRWAGKVFRRMSHANMRDEEEAEEEQDGDAEALRQKQPVASGQPRSNSWAGKVFRRMSHASMRNEEEGEMHHNLEVVPATAETKLADNNAEPRAEEKRHSDQEYNNTHSPMAGLLPYDSESDVAHDDTDVDEGDEEAQSGSDVAEDEPQSPSSFEHVCDRTAGGTGDTSKSYEIDGIVNRGIGEDDSLVYSVQWADGSTPVVWSVKTMYEKGLGACMDSYDRENPFSESRSGAKEKKLRLEAVKAESRRLRQESELNTPLLERMNRVAAKPWEVGQEVKAHMETAKNAGLFEGRDSEERTTQVMKLAMTQLNSRSQVQYPAQPTGFRKLQMARVVTQKEAGSANSARPSASSGQVRPTGPAELGQKKTSKKKVAEAQPAPSMSSGATNYSKPRDASVALKKAKKKRERVSASDSTTSPALETKRVKAIK